MRRSENFISDDYGVAKFAYLYYFVSFLPVAEIFSGDDDENKRVQIALNLSRQKRKNVPMNVMGKVLFV